MLVVYSNNEDTTIEWGNAPKRWSISPLGKVVSIEFYRGELETVCIALTERKTYADKESHTLDIQLAPDRSIISYGYSMIGRPPTGRLDDYEPTGNGDEMRTVPTDWCVDLIDNCKPMGDCTYKAIHVCHCVRVSLPVAA